MALDKSTFPPTQTPDRPSSEAVVVTPHDTNDLTAYTRAIYVGGIGNLTVVMAGSGNTVTFTAIPVGTILPIAVSRIKATLTTATLIVAMW